MIVLEFFKKFEVYSCLILAFLILIREWGAVEQVHSMSPVIGVDFEVYGKVQGVFFRKFTQSKAKELGLNGWCMNTEQGTVLGYVEGNKTQIDEMKNWLQRVGSPKSSIEKAEFRNEKELQIPTLESFVIKK